MLLAPPFGDELKIECLCGCAQSPSYSFNIENNASTVEKLYYDFISKYHNGLPKDFREVHDTYNFWNLKEQSELAKKAYHQV